MSHPTPEINTDTVTQLVQDESDFGFEMKVGHVFEKAPPQRIDYQPPSSDPPKHGETYPDPVLNKPRQFDYRWQITFHDHATNITSRVALAVECKNLSRRAPVIVCGRPRWEHETYTTAIVSRYDTFRRGPVFAVQRSQPHHQHFSKAGEFVGKSVVRIRPTQNGRAFEATGDSDIHERWSQSLASAADLVTAACKAANTTQMTLVTLVLPIVVVPDETLWLAEFNDMGEMLGKARQAQECQLFVASKARIQAEPANATIAHTLPNIHFYTLSGFQAFIFALRSDKMTWVKLFPPFADVRPE